MADQPTKAMTLREAVEIVYQRKEDYVYGAIRSSTGSVHDAHVHALARWDRARAIVDAAVEAQEALCAVLKSGAERGDDGPEKRLLDAHFAANDKLRALERGEDPKP